MYLKKDISYKDIKGLRNNIDLAVKHYPDENESIINNSNKVIKGIDLIILLIDNDNLRIPGQYYAKPLDNTNLSWIKSKDEYEHVADDAGSNASSEFKKLKQKS